MIEDLEVVGKKEEFVLDDRTADIAAKIVVGKVANGLIKEIAGIEKAVPCELVRRTVEGVGAGLEDDVCHGAAGAAEFGVVVAG